MSCDQGFHWVVRGQRALSWGPMHKISKFYLMFTETYLAGRLLCHADQQTLSVIDF